MTDADSATPAVDDRYNPMFETFVGTTAAGEQDLTNLVSYALYKSAKRQWIVKFKKEKKRPPTQDELIAYYETWTATTIDALRARAQNSLAEFGESVVDDAKPAILRDALRGKFFTDVGRAMFANLCYTLILIAVVILLKWQGVDFLELLNRAKP